MNPIFKNICISVFGFASECKHTPTCSKYTCEQIKRHGTIKGLYQGYIRILSCK